MGKSMNIKGKVDIKSDYLRPYHSIKHSILYTIEFSQNNFQEIQFNFIFKTCMSDFKLHTVYCYRKFSKAQRRKIVNVVDVIHKCRPKALSNKSNLSNKCLCIHAS